MHAGIFSALRPSPVESGNQMGKQTFLHSGIKLVASLVWVSVLSCYHFFCTGHLTWIFLMFISSTHSHFRSHYISRKVWLGREEKNPMCPHHYFIEEKEESNGGDRSHRSIVHLFPTLLNHASPALPRTKLKSSLISKAHVLHQSTDN